jgi:hypothetical protein
MAGELDSLLTTNVIGIDCAAQPTDVGLALGAWTSGERSISETYSARTWPDIVSTINGWVSGPTLLCLDAPLGWPARLGVALHAHSAGEAIRGEANQLFRRETDDAVYEVLKKRSLDIGADRIARASLAALRLLGDLRVALNQLIPLSWEPARVVGIQAIEVYPAATLRARGLVDKGYKGPAAEARAARVEINDGLSRDIRIDPAALVRGQERDHILDAIVCVAAGFDFLAGMCRAPARRAVAEREGWIWVRYPAMRTD